MTTRARRPPPRTAAPAPAVPPAGGTAVDRPAAAARAGSAQLQQWVTAHRVPVLGTAAAAVAGLALLMRRRTGRGVTATGSTAAPAIGGTTAYTPGVYDSTASDLYNTLQPMLEQLQRGQEALADLYGSDPRYVPPPTSTPGTYPAPGAPGAPLFTPGGSSTGSPRILIGRAPDSAGALAPNPAGVVIVPDTTAGYVAATAATANATGTGLFSARRLLTRKV